MAAFNQYFDNLAAAAMNEKAFLEEFVTNQSTRNADMDATINNLKGKNR